MRWRYRAVIWLLSKFRDPYMDEARRRMQELAKCREPRWHPAMCPCGPTPEEREEIRKGIEDGTIPRRTIHLPKN